MIIVRFYLLISLIVFLGACSSFNKSSNGEPDISKIKFDITEIDENGLIGPQDGKRLIVYIFYIPYDKSKKKEVYKIDRSVRFYKKTSTDLTFYQCIGEGATQEMLLKLSSLKYIRKIEPFYAE